MSDAPISARPHAFYIRPAPGWLHLLFDEVTALVNTPLQKYKYEPKVTLLKGTVKLHRCDWRQGLEIMLRLTTAHDVEWLVLESKCTKWSEVDAILTRFPWDSILPNRDVPVHVSTDVFHGFSSSSAKLRENFCKISGLTHVSDGAEFRFKMDLQQDFLKISVSLCGDPLYKRGYKSKMSATAPLPEHQAAACSRWSIEKAEGESIGTVFVPFAGSGTFGFETLLVLSGSGPGAFDRKFACDQFPCTPPATMSFFRRKLNERFQNAPHPHLIYNDFNEDALSTLKINVNGFPFLKGTEILEGDFFNLKPTFPENGKVLILLNPPYGNRLAQNSAIATLYGRLGAELSSLSKKYPNRILGGCICPDKASWTRFTKELGNPQCETLHFTHGGKEMRIVRWKS